ncbi:uncharacterized protein BO66DRAFT_438649 [Aspergillus aculeatinus CBS 121060]|uniref:Uncharacterized protein n=1 Tax=Aspergillus aculeatinus CBS 121060 TaxID=1448322 RepID=A0ACD1H8J0_9EURO|nr:hypothetical protein BO66DRAFT_438649 [Aspergillus aculeatinus CBS 121060]RAH69945.1 hypothetical protein BO66DRAFT_438649 [Aspergillus aculeatinus CBS 121060]
MFNLSPRYEPSNHDFDPGRLCTRLVQQRCYLLVWLITIVISAGIGGLVGSRLDHHRPCPGVYSNPSIPLRTNKEVFTYNRTFGADPRDDANTQAAWDSIVPLGQGTVRYPAPDTDQIYYTVSVVHQLHCLSLMCAADATLEPVDAALGGVTGWGAERVCRDYAALAAWAEERRVSDARGFD